VCHQDFFPFLGVDDDDLTAGQSVLAVGEIRPSPIQQRSGDPWSPAPTWPAPRRSKAPDGLVEELGVDRRELLHSAATSPS
jgi:hypothetical protein